MGHKFKRLALFGPTLGTDSDVFGPTPGTDSDVFGPTLGTDSDVFGPRLPVLSSVMKGGTNQTYRTRQSAGMGG